MSKISNREGKLITTAFGGWGWGGSLCPGFGTEHTLVKGRVCFSYYWVLCIWETPPHPAPSEAQFPEEAARGRQQTGALLLWKHSCFCRKAKNYKDLAVWGRPFPPIPCAETKSGEMPQITWGSSWENGARPAYRPHETVVLNANFFFFTCSFPLKYKPAGSYLVQWLCVFSADHQDLRKVWWGFWTLPHSQLNATAADGQSHWLSSRSGTQ